jgi:hypothetical protein
MISGLSNRLEQIAQAAEADSTALAYQLADELSRLPDGFDALDPILRFMEEHPHFDFGCPGPLVHFLESFHTRGYEDRLCRSVRRRPTPQTVWMLNRVINGSAGASKSHYLSLLDEVLAHPGLDTQTLARARQFRALHQ